MANQPILNESGQTILEYALIIAGLSLAMILLIVGFGTGVMESMLEAVFAVS